MAGDPDACEQVLDSMDAQCRRLPTDPIPRHPPAISRGPSLVSRQGRFEEVGDAGRAAAADRPVHRTVLT